jgi:hypothetical protein
VAGRWGQVVTPRTERTTPQAELEAVLNKYLHPDDAALDRLAVAAGGSVWRELTRVASAGQRPDDIQMYRYKERLYLYDGTHPIAQLLKEKDCVRTSGESRLYLYDGANLVAEIGWAPDNEGRQRNQLLRYYELGPGENFRLAVRHRRHVGRMDRILATKYQHIRREVTDEYVYGPGMTSLALVGVPNEDENGEHGSIVRRFALWDMPLPGDNRHEVIHDDAIDDILLTASSPLFMQGARPASIGLPPNVSQHSVSAVGSALLAPHSESLGMLLPHTCLLEDVYQPDAELIDPQELPDIQDRSIGTELLDLLDSKAKDIPIVNFTYRMAKSIVLVKEGMYDAAHAEVEAAAWDLALAPIELALQIDPVGFAKFIVGELPGLEAAVQSILSTYRILSAALQVVPTLTTLLDGRDPETGSSVTPIQWLVAAHTALGITKDLGVPLIFAGHGCFPASTLISTEAGPRPIESLVAGDRVWAFSGNRLRLQPVVALHRHSAPTMWIEMDSYALELTATQPMLVATHGFVAASELREGDYLVDGELREHRITAVHSAQPTAHVYNLSVANDETYLVGERQLVAHNKPGPVATTVAKLRALKHEHHHPLPEHAGIRTTCRACGDFATREYIPGQGHRAILRRYREGDMMRWRLTSRGLLTSLFERFLSGFWKGLQKHTEARGLDIADPKAGDRLVFTGQLPPCSHCRIRMRLAAANDKASVVYRFRARYKVVYGPPGMTVYWSPAADLDKEFYTFTTEHGHHVFHPIFLRQSGSNLNDKMFVRQ